MKKKKEFIVNFVYYGCILIIVYLLGKYLLPVIVPFIIGFLLAYLARQISFAILKKHDKRLSVVVLVLLYFILVLAIAIASVTIISKIAGINYGVIYTDYLEPALNILYREALAFNQSLPSSISGILSEATKSIFDALQSGLMTATTYIIKFVRDILTGLPSTIVTTIVIAISSIYFLVDYDSLMNTTNKLLPEKTRNIIEKLISFIKNNIFKIIKSYIIIIVVTCTELFVAFVIMRIPNAALIALLISLMDILPILGVGTVLIPWGIIEFVFGNILFGIEIFVTYIAITIIRNIIEPKLVGTTLGLSPLLTLMAMIIGLGLFGILGMIGLPLLCAFILYLKGQENPASEEEPIKTM